MKKLSHATVVGWTALPGCSVLFAVLIWNWLAPFLVAEGVHSIGCSWRAISPNAEFVYVGLCPRSVDEQIQFLRNRFPGRDGEISDIEKELRDIHRRFPQQGMYRNDGSNSPIWIMSDWHLEGQPTSDGERLVVPGQVADCFDPGLIARIYGPQGSQFDVTIQSITPWYIPWALKLSSFKADLRYPDYSDAVLGSTGNTLVVATSSNDFIEVSLADGHVLQSTLAKRAARQFFTSPAGAALSLLFVALVWGAGWGVKTVAYQYLRSRQSAGLQEKADFCESHVQKSQSQSEP